MKRNLGRVLAVLAIVAGSAVVAAPASASDLPGSVCILNQNTWLRDMPWGVPLRTLGAGRGFRVHWTHGGSDFGVWHYGHGAEAPAQDGFIPAGNCNF